MTAVAIGISIDFPAVRTAFGQGSDDTIEWLTGRELDRHNKLAFSASWTDAPLRNRLAAFAKQQKTGVFLDRRVDPSQLINVAIARGTPEQFLWNVAEECGLGICRIDDFYYLGPRKTAAVLPHAWKLMKKDSSRLRRTSAVKWAERQPIRIAAIVEPKKLLNELGIANKFKITNLDILRHDVWSGFELPPTSLDGRVAIQLVGFGKWIKRSADGSEITIVDFPEIENGQMEIKELSNPKQTASEMKARFPDLRISTSRTSIKATGPTVRLSDLRSALVDAQTATVQDNQSAPWSLTTKASREAILKKVAEATGKELVVAPDAKRALTEQVTVSVKNAPLDKLIKEILKGSGLTFNIDDSQLQISH